MSLCPDYDCVFTVGLTYPCVLITILSFVVSLTCSCVLITIVSSTVGLICPCFLITILSFVAGFKCPCVLITIVSLAVGLTCPFFNPHSIACWPGYQEGKTAYELAEELEHMAVMAAIEAKEKEVQDRWKKAKKAGLCAIL